MGCGKSDENPGCRLEKEGSYIHLTKEHDHKELRKIYIDHCGSKIYTIHAQL